ncbi:MAG: hypothetical protein ABEJ46_02990, partial [Gemmatimonadota bacterium]
MYPIENGRTGRGTYLLQVAASVEPTQSALSDLRWALGGGVVLMTLAGFGVGAWIAGRSVRPIRSVIRQAEQIEMSRHEDGIDVEADSWEVRRLVDVLNSMLNRLEETFDSQRRFLADAGHE